MADRPIHVDRDFVQARLDTVFALLFLAETDGLAPHDAIEEAGKAIEDGQQILLRLSASDQEQLLPQFQRLRAVIEEIRANLGCARTAD